MSDPTEVVIEGVFDDMRVADVQALEEASRKGPVHVRVIGDQALKEHARFPESERMYFLEALRWVSRVSLSGASSTPANSGSPLERAAAVPPRRRDEPRPARRVLVSGCYDWLHTGHICFFEEAAECGSLYVTVGSDQSVSEHKGPEHPIRCETDRRYMVASVRWVSEARIASGSGWLDWVPDAEEIRPDIFVVNADGDRPEKRAYCAAHGIDYKVLKRLPRVGLSARSSTELRGY